MSREVSQSKPYAREARFEDCAELALTMRKEDREEIWHHSRFTPLLALQGGLLMSKKCWSIIRDDRVVGMFGVASVDGTIGVPWMLASDELVDIQIAFLRGCKDYLEEMFQGFELLCNSVWIGNAVHIRWLRWMGFKFLPAKPAGPDGELFYEFYKVNYNV